MSGPTTDHHDVLIVGGGPAGSAAAITLRRLGLGVAVLERAPADGGRAGVGETLPPPARAELNRLGLWERVAADHHRPSPGSVSIWGGDRPYANDFVFDPDGEGRHLDRARFDATLRHAAEEAGATLLAGHPVSAARREPSGRWMVEAEHEGGRVRLSGSFLIDAAGRHPWPGRPARRRRRLDRLVALVGRVEGTDAPGDDDQRTWVEACPTGWWFSAPAVAGGLIAAFFTDADLLDGNRARPEQVFEARLQTAPHTRRRLGPDAYRLQGTPRVVPAATTLARPAVGPGWLAVGDAAWTIDPLSSHGITRALRTGADAAEAVASALIGGDEAALESYGQRLEADFRAYLRTRQRFYALERRWPDSPFWRRRYPPVPIPADPAERP